jgi:hypothetical protein
VAPSERKLCNPKFLLFTPNEEHVDIFIIKSKTDCYRNCKNVFITKLNSPYCPVSILQRYISLAGIDLDSDDPKFLLFTPNVAKADLTISLALVYDSFSFFFLRINVLE